MRTLLILLAALALQSARAEAQTAVDPAPAQLRESVAFGVTATPALEGGGPWFLPAVRLSASLGARVGVDVDAGRIYGGVNKYSEIRRFQAVQLRILGEPRPMDMTARYWAAGLMYFRIAKFDGKGTFVGNKPHVGLTIGRGWSQVFSNGTRVVNEIGFMGGEGFMFYATAGVQWGPPRQKSS
jgi:hypothetical protein